MGTSTNPICVGVLLHGSYVTFLSIILSHYFSILSSPPPPPRSFLYISRSGSSVLLVLWPCSATDLPYSRRLLLVRSATARLTAGLEVPRGDPFLRVEFLSPLLLIKRPAVLVIPSTRVSCAQSRSSSTVQRCRLCEI
jgi:hypothetical protein